MEPGSSPPSLTPDDANHDAFARRGTGGQSVAGGGPVVGGLLEEEGEEETQVVGVLGPELRGARVLGWRLAEEVGGVEGDCQPYPAHFELHTLRYNHQHKA